MVSHIYANLPTNIIARPPHPESGYSHDQEIFLAPSVDKQTHNYDIEYSGHFLSQSPRGIGIEP